MHDAGGQEQARLPDPGELSGNFHHRIHAESAQRRYVWRGDSLALAHQHPGIPRQREADPLASQESVAAAEKDGEGATLRRCRMVPRPRREADHVTRFEPASVRVDEETVQDDEFLDPAMLMREGGGARVETDQVTSSAGFRIEA